MLHNLLASALLAVATVIAAWQLGAGHLRLALGVAVLAIVAGYFVSREKEKPTAVLSLAGALVGVGIGPLVRAGVDGYLTMPAVLVSGIALVAALTSSRSTASVLAGLIAVNLYPMSDTIPLRIWPPFVLQFAVLVLPSWRFVAHEEMWSRTRRMITAVAEPFLLTMATWLLVIPFLKVPADALPLLINYYLPIFGVPATVAAAAAAVSWYSGVASTKLRH